MANIQLSPQQQATYDAAIKKYYGTSGSTNTAPTNQVVTQGQSFTDSGGRTGIVNYDSNTGAKLASGSTTNSIANQMGAVGGSGSTGNTGSTTGSRTTSNTSNTTSGIDTSDLESQYKALFGLSPEEKKLQKQQFDLDQQLRGFNRSADQMNLNIGQQPIAHGFISGQQSAVAQQSALDRKGFTDQQQTLQQKLAMAQAQRQASMDAVRFSLDRADKTRDFNADEAYRTAALNQKDTAASGFSLSQGENRYDSTGNLIATGPAKTYAPTGGSSTTPTPTQQKSLLTNTLNTGTAPNGTKIGAPRGADGFVDPYVYLEAFKQWTGTPATFLSAFPVKTNVNPLSYSLLPAALQGSVTTNRAA